MALLCDLKVVEFLSKAPVRTSFLCVKELYDSGEDVLYEQSRTVRSWVETAAISLDREGSTRMLKCGLGYLNTIVSVRCRCFDVLLCNGGRMLGVLNVVHRH